MNHAWLAISSIWEESRTILVDSGGAEHHRRSQYRHYLVACPQPQICSRSVYVYVSHISFIRSLERREEAWPTDLICDAQPAAAYSKSVLREIAQKSGDFLHAPPPTTTTRCFATAPAADRRMRVGRIGPMRCRNSQYNSRRVQQVQTNMSACTRLSCSCLLYLA